MNNYKHLNNYINLIIETSKRIDLKIIKEISDIVFKTIKKKKFIYIMGNGGSAAVANHMLCDFNKNIKLSTKKKMMPKMISLTNSNEIITAIGNDIKYNKIFVSQIENYLNKSDTIILLSCSGTSKNILEVLKFSKNKQVNTILLTGFCSKKNVNASIHLNLDCKNYGVSEDLFSSILHMISQQIRINYSKKKEIL